jgi:four helix bundle protein
LLYVQDFRKLLVWQKADAFVVRMDELCLGLPRFETYRLVDQLKRASSSISLNIAEGCGSGTQLELLRFLRIAFRSACEAEAALRQCAKRALAPVDEDLERIIEIKKMLCGLMKRVKESMNRTEL